MAKRKPLDPSRALKRTRSYKITQTERRHNCRLGTTVKLNENIFLIALATPLFLFLIAKDGKYKRLSWQEWDKLQLKLETHDFVWNKKIRQTLKFLRKKVKFEWKLSKLIKVDRTPKIKRTPVPKHKPKPKGLKKMMKRR